MDLWNEFHGPNAGYVLELYERYQRDPNSVDAATREFFEHWTPPPEGGLLEVRPPASAATAGDGSAPRAARLKAAAPEAWKVAAALNLAQSIRWYGHFAAQLDPLGGPPPGDPALQLDTYGLREADLERIPASIIGGPAAERSQNALEAIRKLREIYSGDVGHDYIQVRIPEERQWLREAAESGRFTTQNQPIDPVKLLERMTQVEAFEHFLQRSFVAKTRFSIEGLDMLVPVLDEVVGGAAESGIYNILIGMAHRGRLNVLAHVLEKPIDQILAEFKDPLRRRMLQNEPLGWTGDVKYHAGARHTFDDHNPRTLDLTIQMAPNPSHLEAVNPVVEGMARAAGTRADRPGPATFNPGITLPILIHGDASFPGQGVIAETLNLYQLEGYSTGGTIHIIANNQIGFTTNPTNSRSTLFASDLAKGFRIPILHVNADDPEACLMAARLAFTYRQQFHRDFMIDLIGYRRLGHNEGDEPAFTQPRLYETIRAHPTVRQLWAKTLEDRGLISAEDAQDIYDAQIAELQRQLESLDPEALQEPIPPPPPPGAARSVQTAVPAERLMRLNQELLALPPGFALHSRLARIRSRRENIFDDPNWPTIDWATAEELAMATILEDGTPIRLTGQDVERGTFSHRHAVLHDVNSGQTYTPLQALPEAQAAFEIYNSPLSEAAALGFEFGYDIEAPERMVIWEAQYGDFVNNAQTMIDEFISSARDKWGELPGLTLLLPHGYEGQGPDHSSGRLERFLNLVADNNLRVANCTTAANFFHLLRRQAALLERDRLPLVVMTPKSILRHPLVASPLRDFTDHNWQPVIDRQSPKEQELSPAADVRRLLLCSGKIYIDLMVSETQPEHPEVGITRLEQLAPFPMKEVRALLAGYPHLETLVWVQEEPENMGAWEFVRPYLMEALNGCCPLGLVSRPRSASPAEGSNNLHTYNQKQLVEVAYTQTTKQPQVEAK